jgi:hypothetical protein
MAEGKIVIQASNGVIPPQDWDLLLLDKASGVNLDKPVFWAVGDGHPRNRVHSTVIMTQAYMAQKARQDKGSGFGCRGYVLTHWDKENSYRAYRDARDGKVRLIHADDMTFLRAYAPVKTKAGYEGFKLGSAPEGDVTDETLFRSRNPEAETDGILESGK